MKFQKTLAGKYYTEHKNLVVLVCREGREWQAEVRIREGCQFMRNIWLDSLYTYGRSRRDVVEFLCECIDDKIEREIGFEAWVAHKHEASVALDARYKM